MMQSKLEKLRKAFCEGHLRVRSVSPEGKVEWKRVIAVQRAEVSGESIHEIGTEVGTMILTGGHRVYVNFVDKVEAEQLKVGDLVQVVANEQVMRLQVMHNRKLSDRRYMYDLTAEDWHNFVLAKSKVLITNSPDRNYHFRPPAHEETIQQFNRVFGFIWEDSELGEFIERSLDMVISSPPRTPFANIDQFCQARPEWRTLLLTGAMGFALNALRYNWIADEFSLAPETLVQILLPDEKETNITLDALYSVCTSSQDGGEIGDAFKKGCLQVRSVTKDGHVIKCVVSDVLKHQTENKGAFQVTVEGGATVTATLDHSLFTLVQGEIVPIRTDNLKIGSTLVRIEGNGVNYKTVVQIIPVEALSISYDLSVPGPENFVLTNGILAHNSYSIGGVSLDLDKSSKYESAAASANEQFDKMLEKSKATVNVIRGLQQPRFGTGIRSSFGPYSGRGILNPRKFSGM